MISEESDIKNFAIGILSEIASSDLINITVRVFTSLKKIATIPDIMTDIRILPGVAICRQASPVKKSKKGRDVVDLDVKYYASHTELAEYLPAVGKAIKKIKGIDIVRMIKVDGQDVSNLTDQKFIF